jgi:hypothetical protein
MSQHHKSTRRMKRLRKEFRAESAANNTPCWMDGMPIAYEVEGVDDSFELDHYYPVSTHPELQEDPGNFRASHLLCNRTRGNDAPEPGLGTLSRAWA